MRKIQNMLLPSLKAALLGALISFLILTTLSAGNIFKQCFPAICLIFFMILDFVLDKLAYVKEHIWLKPVILVGVAAVLLMLLILL